MSETAKSLLTIVALLVGLPVLILVLRDRISRVFRRLRNPPEKIAADQRAYNDRLLNPDWTFYERHLSRPIPQALRELYSDHALIMRVYEQGFDYDEHERINLISPLSKAEIIQANPALGFDIIPIAVTDFGDPIYLRPGPAESDVVYVTHHDGGDTDILADSVTAMLARLRQPSKKT